MPYSTESAHQNPWAIGEVVFGVPFLLSLAANAIVPFSAPQGIIRTLMIPVGIVLFLIGIRWIVLARREFAAYHQPTDPGQPTGRIITSGVFAHSRNPLYLGAVFIFAGLSLAFNLFWAIIALLFSIVLCQYVLILPEERYLANKFGEEYTQYAASVRRWLG